MGQIQPFDRGREDGRYRVEGGHIEATKLARPRFVPYISGMIYDDGLAGYPVYPAEISISASSV